MKNNLRYSQMLSGVIAASLVISQASLARAQTPIAPKTSNSVKTAKTLNHAFDADLRAAGNNADKVRSLLARGADPNTKDSDPDATPLLSNAATFGNLAVVRALVEAGADVQAPNAKGMTPLSHAVLAENNLEVVKYLLQSGANTESKTPSGMTPLMSAASAGQTELVRVLMRAGANINARSSINATPLFYACDNKDAPDERMKIARSLVEAGADVSIAASHNDKRAYQAASANELLDIEKYLIAIVNRDAALYNVTSKAIREGKTATTSTRLASWQAFKDELAKGANPRYTSLNDGITTLTNLIASLNNVLLTLDDNDVTMKTVIARSDLDARTKDGGYTALHVAIDRDNSRLVAWLIKAGADLNILDAKNQTPLDFAIEAKNQKIATQLENAGAKTYEELQDEIDLAFFAAMLTPGPSVPAPKPSPPAAPPIPQTPANTIAKSPLDKINMEGQRQGLTVLMMAARDDNATEVARLLKAGANVDIVGPEDGYTALFFAIFGNSTASVKALIQAGANVNFLSYEGNHTLPAASARGNLTIVRALVEAGADLKYLDDAIENAKRGENIAVIEYLTSLKTAAKIPIAKTPIASNPKPNSVPTQSTPAASKSSPAPYKSTMQDQALHFALTVIQYKRNVEQKVPDSDWRAVRAALAEGATAHYADKAGVTALMLIAIALPDATDEIERQIFQRADINAQDEDGSTALHYAAKNGYNKMVEWLIAAKADLNIIDNSRSTPLDVANVNRQSVAAIALENAGARRAEQLKVFAQTATQSTPAAATAAKTDPVSTIALAKLLQQKTFDVKGAESLFKSGADLNAFDSGGKTPLMRASEWGTVEAVKWLLAKKVAVDTADKNGMTALMYGAGRASDDIAWNVVAALLDANAQWKMKNKAGKTAYDLALAKSNDWTVMALDIEMGT